MAKSENGIVTASTDGTVVIVEPGQNILLDVTSPDLVVFTQDGSDLIITSIADGSKIELEGFFSQAGSELPPQLTLSDGSVITAADVTGLVEAFDPGAVAPAAGGAAGGAGGGASFSAYEDDGIGEGIGIEGLLDPTALGFPADEPLEFAIALPGQPQFLLNEIGLGTDLFGRGGDGGESRFKEEEPSDLEQQMAALGNASIDAFIEAASGEQVDFIELRNNTGSDQSTGGNGASTVGEGVTTISLIGPEGDPISFDLPDVTVPAGGHLLILQADPSDDADSDVSTLYLVFNADGDIIGGGPLGASGDWPLGNDTTEPIGVLVTWSLGGGSVAQLDTFLANGGEFEPLALNDNWVGLPEDAAVLDIFGDSATFNGQISTQEVVSDPIFEAYAPVTLADMIAAGPLGEDFFHDIPVNNIFGRVDNFDSDTAGDWTTGIAGSPGLVNNGGVTQYNGPIEVDKDPSNSSQETAQNVDEIFGTGSNPNVEDSDDDPHVTVTAIGTDNIDWYSFTVLADGTRVILDIDGGETGSESTDFDSMVFLYDEFGNLVDYNDDDAGDPGSPNSHDSYMSPTLPAGTYYVAVSDYGDDGEGPDDIGYPIPAGGTYSLHITIEPINGIIDPNPQDPYNDDMNPGQPTGPEATADEELDNNGQNIIIVGENEDEFLNTVTGAIEGGRAQDFLVGGEGNDILSGGAHNDYLEGGSGNDILEGNSGGDVLIDDQGMDILIGGSGTDVIFGRRGAEDMEGGYGNDERPPEDFFKGGPRGGPDGTEIGNEDGAFESLAGDLLIGDDLYLTGGYGNDQGPPTISRDFMYGGSGNDGAFGDEQEYMRDIIVAGDGDDLIFGDNAHLPDYILENPIEILFLQWDIWNEANNNPYDFVDGMRYEVEYYYGGADLIYAGWGDDVIFGQGGDDLILAGHGEDVVAGGSGNDIMRGNEDDDSMFGGYGDDIMYGDNDNDFMQGNEDDDTMYGGSGHDNMYGGSGEDLMYGGSQADQMFGNSQEDTMFGGTGNDLMVGGSGNDLMYGGNDDDRMFGESQNDVMYGGSGDDFMRGNSGNDTMYGGSGNDEMLGDSGEDLMYGGTGSVDTMFGGNQADVMYG
ncbi:MAG: DVUA0089 family protein, partial [Pseudomonas marincola]